MAHAETVARQDYLKQIYLQQQETGRATTQALAARLGVKAPSVTAMLKQLADDPSGPFVRYTPYRGVELTEQGVAVALEMLRHHRLIELFLAELLAVPWDRVHDEAEQLEHVLSEDLEERIAVKLGHPSFDPHGDPIPGRDGTLPTREVVSLTMLAPGEWARVARFGRQEQGVLHYLATLGLVLDAAVCVETVAPYGGVVTVRVRPPGTRDETSHALGADLAANILVSAAGSGGRDRDAR
ncbi:MAG: metal-dependent transcriptional regulator [Chloroflexota bacterium]